jgi:AcrR family transcriptional regulator
MEDQMKTFQKRSEKTRQRLLEAACEVFADKGYRDATIAEICDLAGTNGAAVNYHFGDKEHLYAEAWRHAFHVSLEAFPSDGKLGKDTLPEDRLRAHVSALLHRIFDDGKLGHFSKILFSELGNPTGVLAEVIREAINPQREQMLTIVGGLLGDGASEVQVMLCEMSIINQCLALAFRKKMFPIIKRMGKNPPPEIDQLAEHIVKFSLGGIRAIRQGMEIPQPQCEASS